MARCKGEKALVESYSLKSEREVVSGKWCENLTPLSEEWEMAPLPNSPTRSGECSSIGSTADTGDGLAQPSLIVVSAHSQTSASSRVENRSSTVLDCQPWYKGGLIYLSSDSSDDSS